MSDYHRSTLEMTLDTLTPITLAALQTHIEKYELGPVLEDSLICIESVSEKIKKGLFSGPGPKLLRSTLIVTSRWLFEMTKADDHPLYVRSARLADLTVSDYEKSPFYQRMPDTGVEVTGRYTDTSESSSSFIGLGQDPAGDKFKTLLIQSVHSAH